MEVVRMYCMVKGKVINVREGYKSDKPTVELYQKGQGNVVRIFNVPPEIAYAFGEMEEATFYCDVIPWVNKKGSVTLVAKFVGEDDGNY